MDKCWSDFCKIISTLAVVITTIIALFASFRFWPNFIRQKRLENANGNSWKVLEQIDRAEKAIEELFLANRRRDPETQKQKQADVITALRALSTGLLALKGLTPDFSDQRDWLNQTIEFYSTLMEGEMVPSSASVDLLQKLGETPLDKDGPKFVKLEKLKRSVADIANLSHKGL